jgi:hypothetical protein
MVLNSGRRDAVFSEGFLVGIPGVGEHANRVLLALVHEVEGVAGRPNITLLLFRGLRVFVKGLLIDLQPALESLL